MSAKNRSFNVQLVTVGISMLFSALTQAEDAKLLSPNKSIEFLDGAKVERKDLKDGKVHLRFIYRGILLTPTAVPAGEEILCYRVEDRKAFFLASRDHLLVRTTQSFDEYENTAENRRRYLPVEFEKEIRRRFAHR